MNRDQRRSLLYCAERYCSWGYTVALTKEKAMVGEYHSQNQFAGDRSQSVHVPKDKEWDGISIILHGLVCVDFDTETVQCKMPLPHTWIERTKRGWHYFYRLPKGLYTSRIAYQEGLDLLTRAKDKKRLGYPARRRITGQAVDNTWYGHALVSPTPGYQLVSGKLLLPRQELPRAPKWVLAAMSEE